MERAGVEGAGAPRVLRGRLVLEEAVVDGALGGYEGVNCQEQQGVRPKIDGASR